MIYTLVSKYNKTKEEAGKMTAYDYTFIIALENLNAQREKYLYDKK